MRIHGTNVVPESLREFGIDANVIKTHTYDLNIARNLERIEIGGSCIWGIQASDNTCQIDIRVNDQLRDPLPFRNGMYIRGIPYSRLYVSNEVQVDKSITIMYAAETVDNIQIENPASNLNEMTILGEVDVNVLNQPIEVEFLAPPDVNATVVSMPWQNHVYAATNTTITPNNWFCLTLGTPGTYGVYFLRADPGNVGPIHVVKIFGAVVGFPLFPGDALSLNVDSAAIPCVYNPNATPEILHYMLSEKHV